MQRPAQAQEGRLLHPPVKAQPPHALAQAVPQLHGQHNGENQPHLRAAERHGVQHDKAQREQQQQNHQRNAHPSQRLGQVNGFLGAERLSENRCHAANHIQRAAIQRHPG